MNSLIKKLGSLIEKLASSRVFKSDFDYHLVGESRDRAAGPVAAT